MTENIIRSLIIACTLWLALLRGDSRAWLDEVWDAIRDYREALGV